MGLCTVKLPTSCPSVPPRYADVKPIFDSTCNGCHAVGVKDGPWPLDDYQSIVDWADLIRADLVSCVMPPADGGVALSDEDRLAILTWARCDFPR